MITNAKLLIDQDCPMCKAYGTGFVKTNLIDDQTLSAYQYVSDKTYTRVDMNRAKNEIALVLENETIYGLDALIKILSHHRPFINKMLHWPWIYAPLKLLYHFISYNRKQIYPVADSLTHKYPCTPDLHLAYRWAYIVLVALFTGLILNSFSYALFNQLGLPHTPYIEWIMCFGQIIWQATIVTILHPTKRLDYLGNMSTVSLIGGLLVLVILIIQSIVSLNALVLIIFFGCIVLGMLIEHIRRCKLMGLSSIMTLSWILFRSLFLIIILYNIAL